MNCAPMREKSHVYWDSCLSILHIYCDKLHEEKTGGYTCIPHTIMEVCSLKEQ